MLTTFKAQKLIVMFGVEFGFDIKEKIIIIEINFTTILIFDIKSKINVLFTIFILVF